MELAVPKMDQKSQISLVLGSNIIKIIKNDRVHGFWAQEGENIPSSKGKRRSGEAMDRNELNVDIGVYEWSFIRHECWQFQTTSNQLKTTD